MVSIASLAMAAVCLCVAAVESHAEGACAAVSSSVLLQKGAWRSVQGTVDDPVAPPHAQDPSQQSGGSPTDTGERVLFLVRTGGPSSAQLMTAVRSTWAAELKPEELWVMQPDAACKKQYGDNHEYGLSCLEATSEMEVARTRTQFDWLFVVDDDVYVQVAHLRKALGRLSLSAATVYGVPGCGGGKCGKDGFTWGLCGGGGYAVSRQNLLSLVGCSACATSGGGNATGCDLDACVPAGAWSKRLTESEGGWACDVAFGCLAAAHGLSLELMHGLYGNRFPSLEDKIRAVTSSKVPFLSAHRLKPDEMLDMHRLVTEGPGKVALLSDSDESRTLLEIARKMRASEMESKARGPREE